MIINLVSVTAIDTGDILANGDTVIDGWYNGNGDYSLTLERTMPDGSQSEYTVEYPVSSFMRIKTF